MSDGQSDDQSDEQRTRLQRPVSNRSFLSVLPGTTRPAEELDFRPLPEAPTEVEKLRLGQKSWRITLSLVGEKRPPLALELRGDVTVGCGDMLEAGGCLNLDEWDGDAKGVSHAHALLRPTPNSLFLVDHESTNGTFVNGTRLGKGQAHTVQHDDLITLGRLHMRVGIIEKPHQAA